MVHQPKIKINIPLELLSKDMAFHYTRSFVAMEDILYTKKIRFSSFLNMNDPYEYKIPAIGMTRRGGLPFKDVSKALYLLKDTILHKSKILSLVRHGEEEIIDNYQLIFAKPRLWAQYAEAQYGVCLLLNLPALLEKIKSTYTKISIYKNSVTYDLMAGTSTKKNHMQYNSSKSIIDNIRFHMDVNKNDIFFRKYFDFRDENEYRIVLIDWDNDSNSDIYIDLKGVICGVIMGERFKKVYEPLMKNLVTDLNANLYKITYASLVSIIEYKA